MQRKSVTNCWSGRIDHKERKSSFRYHQMVEVVDSRELVKKVDDTCVLIGFECEEGVKRNQGRLGSAKAPDEIRKELAKLPWRFKEDVRLLDIGNVTCTNGKLETAQKDLGEKVYHVLSKSLVPIIIGGGHETLYGHYLGVRQCIGQEADLGIINLDAHFDLRSYETSSSSGTMFRQILEQDQNCNYFVLGIQPFGNTQELFDTAKKLDVRYMIEEDVTMNNISNIEESIHAFIKQHDYVILTLCTDVLNAAFAPGVSAPSPFGLTPDMVRMLIRKIASHPKVRSFDLCEVNPELDEGGRTVKLGAYFVNEAIVANTEEHTL
ncbi:formiminoglutamase [Fictibacillus solisalsi]|uniref:Formimidoylglutamase n=1 Tax=Fictibacillus solisalsi TaxID=459525 RepID=A0A1G9VH54_9BACL|nr:formimidoylglutamase [Fictibacillus solisalsi]SDM71145.1 formiminoglutamase [Fictibacillus solisalsi]